MALSKPFMIVKDPYSADDYKAMFAKHAWTDRNEVDIDKYLTPHERETMCQYEKDRLRNIKKNYDVMIELGIPAKKPYFMQKNRPKHIQPVSESSESDGEWVPSAQKNRKKKGVLSSWKSPMKLKTDTVTPKKPRVQKSTSREMSQKVKVKEVSSTRPNLSSKPPPTGDDGIGDLYDSDSEEFNFEGFTETEIIASEKRALAVAKENNRTLKSIEDGTFQFSENEDDNYEAEMESKAEPQADPETPDEEIVTGDKETAPKRYPRRSVARKDYKEPTVPKDDDYLYCEACDFYYEGDCSVHGPLIVIPDTKVTNDGSDAQRSVHTLPKGLIVKRSKIPLAGDGVWTETLFPKDARFGPYEGLKVEDGEEAQKSGYCWVIFNDGKQISHYVDAEDTHYANWLRYVNCARNDTEQNLLAYQFHGEIFYRTIRPIPPGQELLVWYGDQYAKELGIVEAADMEQLYHDAGFNLFRCDVCGRVFPLESWRDSYQRSHGDQTGSKQYRCHLCNYSNDNNAVPIDHLRSYTGERPFKCDTCGKGFTLAGNLKKHLMIHTGEKPYGCDVCSKRFNQVWALQTHTRIHTGEKPYGCDVCSKRFIHVSNLQKHKRIHTGEKPYGCDVCSKRFTDSSDLQKHKRIHTGEKPYGCDVCSKRFIQVGDLQKHKRIHTGEKPYGCDVCSKRFTDSSHLQKHKRIHTGERPYGCDVCSKRFIQVSNLQRHKRIHTGEKPYTCPVCLRSFTLSQHLKGHMHTHTGEWSIRL